MNPFHEPNDRLRAKGNLSYLDFLRLLEKLWLESHPDIPLQAGFTYAVGQYPIITYRLDLRKPHPSEPKPRFREEIKTPAGEDAILIAGQRFQSVVTFSIMTQIDPHNAEVLLEVFEDFMIEFQPVFKELGASELVYLRRLPDSADSRPGEGVVSRSVSYLLTTEKIIKTTVKKLDNVILNARLFLASDAVMFTTNPSEGTITVRGASFKIGDRVEITGNNPADILAGSSTALPSQLKTGYYLIGNLILTNTTRRYALTKLDYIKDQATPSVTYTPITTLSAGSGYIQLATESGIDVNIEDQESSKFT